MPNVIPNLYDGFIFFIKHKWKYLEKSEVESNELHLLALL